MAVAVVGGMGAVVLFIALSERAQRGNESALSAATVVVQLLFILGVLGACLALALAAAGCNCTDPDPWWSATRAGLLAAAIIGVVWLVLCWVSLARKHYRRASICMVAAGASFGVWAALLSSWSG